MINEAAVKALNDFTIKGEGDACWLWCGPDNGSGYGRFRRGKQRFYAHRVAYEMETGIDPGELFVLHKCDNANCVNPNHLEVGTVKVNTDQAWERDRYVNCRKLSPQDVIDIRESNAHKTEIAEKYGIHLSHVYQIKTFAQGHAILRIREPKEKTRTSRTPIGYLEYRHL